jgi:hypothetical protein
MNEDPDEVVATTARIPEVLWRKVKHRLTNSRMSYQGLIVQLLEAYVSDKELACLLTRDEAWCRKLEVVLTRGTQQQAEAVQHILDWAVRSIEAGEAEKTEVGR